MKTITLSLIKSILILSVIVWSHMGRAGCQYSGGSVSSYTVTVPTVNVQRDVPAGTILWDSGYLTAPVTNSIYCDSVAPIWRGFDDSSLVSVNVLDNHGIYQTNNPGIAIRVWWLSYLNDSPGAQSPADARVFDSPKIQEGTKTCNKCEYRHISGKFYVQLIATGKPITDEPLQLARFTGARTYDTTDQLRLYFTDADVVVNSASCVLNSKNISVDLGKHIEGFHLVHPGDTSAPVGFNINLTCDANTNVNVLFSGTTVSGDATTLALNNLSAPTSAQGVGVQILYHDQPITFGELVPTVKSSAESGGLVLPFTAQILRLNEALKAGEIEATATFEMIYR
ncbi:TPA: fimbrial protein [Salmonella enterica subsp. salamae serovar 30:g,m,s:e,n,x]|nr:fimbrial protein [Salmonella enterica subsp. salamae serovar 30:g,m,s:e,n,x]